MTRVYFTSMFPPSLPKAKMQFGLGTAEFYFGLNKEGNITRYDRFSNLFHKHPK